MVLGGIYGLGAVERLWVSNYLNDTVSAIDINTSKATWENHDIPVGKSPTHLAYDGSMIYVVNTG